MNIFIWSNWSGEIIASGPTLNQARWTIDRSCVAEGTIFGTGRLDVTARSLDGRALNCQGRALIDLPAKRRGRG